MKKYILLTMVILTGCVSRISIEDGVNKEDPAKEISSTEAAVQEVAPSEKI